MNRRQHFIIMCMVVYYWNSSATNLPDGPGYTTSHSIQFLQVFRITDFKFNSLNSISLWFLSQGNTFMCCSLLSACCCLMQALFGQPSCGEPDCAELCFRSKWLCGSLAKSVSCTNVWVIAQPFLLPAPWCFWEQISWGLIFPCSGGPIALDYWEG